MSKDKLKLPTSSFAGLSTNIGESGDYSGQNSYRRLTSMSNCPPNYEMYKKRLISAKKQKREQEMRKSMDFGIRIQQIQRKSEFNIKKLMESTAKSHFMIKKKQDQILRKTNQSLMEVFEQGADTPNRTRYSSVGRGIQSGVTLLPSIQEAAPDNRYHPYLNKSMSRYVSKKLLLIQSDDVPTTNRQQYMQKQKQFTRTKEKLVKFEKELDENRRIIEKLKRVQGALKVKDQYKQQLMYRKLRSSFVPTNYTDKKKDYNKILGIDIDEPEIPEGEPEQLKEIEQLKILKNLQKLKYKQKEIVERCKKNPFVSPFSSKYPQESKPPRSLTHVYSLPKFVKNRINREKRKIPIKIIICQIRRLISRKVAFFKARQQQLKNYYMQMAQEQEELRSQASRFDNPILPENKNANKKLAAQSCFYVSGWIFIYQIHYDGVSHDRTSPDPQVCWSFFIKRRKMEPIWQFHRFNCKILDKLYNFEGTNVDSSKLENPINTLNTFLGVVGKKIVIQIMKEANENREQFENEKEWQEWWFENLRQQLHLEF